MAATGTPLDTLVIDHLGTTATSNFNLTAGHVYALFATGDITINSSTNRHADADWFEPAGAGPREDITSASLDEGVKADGNGYGVIKWGAYNSDHEYTVPITGNGNALALKFVDYPYNDNSASSIHVYIYDTYIPTDPPEGSCNCGAGTDLTQSDPGIGAQSTCPVMSGGVDLTTGHLTLNETDLDSGSLGTGWAQTRSFSSTPGFDVGSGNGANWSNAAGLPVLREYAAGDVGVYTSGVNDRQFHFDGSSYQPTSYAADTLTYNGTSKQYTLTDGSGQRFVFYGFDSSIASAKRGTLASLTDITGLTTTAVTAYDGSNRIQTITRDDGISGVTETIAYTYVTSGSNAGKLASVTLQRASNGGSPSTVRSVNYDYYGSGSSNGSLGDLEMVTVKDSAGTAVDYHYYRYYMSSDPDGYTGGLKMAFGPAAYKRLLAVYSTPDSESDAHVRDYADHYLEYDAEQRVTLHRVAGEGCSTCSGGIGEYTYAYDEAPDSQDRFGYNQWRYKVTETLPDTNTNTIYSNAFGQGMLKVFTDSTTTAQWIDYWRYDDAGRQLLHANPSAVTGFSESYTDLVHRTDTNTSPKDFTFGDISNSDGLLEISEYYTAATAPSAGLIGYLNKVYLRNGDGNTAILQQTNTYTSHTGGGTTVYPVASQTVYAADNGTGDRTTSFTYTWFSDSTRIESETVTQEAVTTGHNGSGDPVSTTSVFDRFGRMIYSIDAAGIVNRTDYDPLTGAAKASVGDASPYAASVLADAPAGYWRLNETSGSTAHDSSGHGHNGTYSGGFTLGLDGGTADGDTSAGFNGSTGAVTVPYSPELNASSFATDFWAYLPSASSGYRTPVGSRWAGPTSKGWNLYVSDAGDWIFLVGTGSGGFQYPSAGAAATNAWTYVAATYDGGTGAIKIYLNGSLAVSSTVTGFVPNVVTDLSIGGNDGGVDFFWPERMDEVAVYDHTLTADQIAAHYAAGSITRTPIEQTSTDTVDSLGRTTKSVDPNGNVTYTVYKDADHEVRTYRGFVATSSTSGTVAGPVEVTREDRANHYIETFTMSPTITVSGSKPTGGESVSNVQSLSRSILNDAGQVIETRVYTSIPGGGYSTSASLGSAGTNYLSTTYHYEPRGWQNAVKAPDGTITRTVHDSLGRLVSTWIGTDDTDATNSDPTGAAAVGNNMVMVSENHYDNDGIGDGNLTLSRATDGSTNYDTLYQSDWRNRLTDSRGPDGVASKTTYDNLGEVTKVETYADGDTDFHIDSGELRGKSETAYDERGQVYQTKAYNVDPSDGSIGHHLTSVFWYDARGMQVKAADPNGLFSKTAFDSLGRVVASYSSFDDDESSYSEALDVAGDTVIEQSGSWYDAAGNVVTSAGFQRLDGDTTTTGSLIGAGNRRSIGVSWYDKLNRLITTANFGTDPNVYVLGSYDLIYDMGPDGIPDEAQGPAPAPDSNDDFIVSQYDYDDAGRQYRTTDNLGHITQTNFDLGGRPTATIENYVNGVASETETDTDRTTVTVYDSQGRQSQLIAYNPKGSGNGVEHQTTTYLYESPFSASLVTSTIYPDSSDTDSSGTDQVKTVYDRLGRTLQSTDQRGVQHDYAFDSAGRLLSDAATLPSASAVDASVLRIEYGYDDLSRVNLITSYDASSGGSVVNQVASTFDGWGNVIISAQEHDGAVDGSTPTVQYTYDDGASGSEAKYVRLSKVTYPNGREVFYNLASDDVGAHLVRLDNIADDDSGTSKYAQYTYLGAGTVTSVAHPAVSGGLTLSYGVNGTYGGWDAFGRIINQEWTNGVGPSTLDQFTYKYDRNSNVTEKTNALESSLSETYDYDGLDRLTEADRNSILLQSWTLDSLGNWRGMDDGTNNQTRDSNAANEITGISGVSWAQPAYDAAGNMTAGPKTGDETTLLHFTYDAWNRQTAVYSDDGLGAPDTELASYAYDGRGYQIRRVEDPNGTPSTQDTYFNEGWQALEVRQDADVNPIDQYVWDARYIDAMVVRFHDGNTDGDYSDAGDNTLYPTTDANFDVTALVNGSDGTVIERYSYLPYGQFTVLDDDFSTDSDGQSDMIWKHHLQGSPYDFVTAQHAFRHRRSSGALGDWAQRDPIEYADGPNIYQFEHSAPVHGLDPSGLIEPVGIPLGGGGYYNNNGDYRPGPLFVPRPPPPAPKHVESDDSAPAKIPCECSGKNIKWEVSWGMHSGWAFVSTSWGSFAAEGKDDTQCLFKETGKGWAFFNHQAGYAVGWNKDSFSVSGVAAPLWPINVGSEMNYTLLDFMGSTTFNLSYSESKLGPFEDHAIFNQGGVNWNMMGMHHEIPIDHVHYEIFRP